MGGGFSTIGAILAIVGSAIIVGLAIYGGFHVLMNIEERFGPVEPSDDVFGEIAHGDCFPAIPECRSHARKDYP